MVKAIKWLNDKIDKGIEIGILVACILTALMTVTVLVEVFSRYIFSLPISWTAELTSILFPWIVFITAISVTRKQAMWLSLFLLTACRQNGKGSIFYL